jgi:hypothetical protein
LAFQVLPVTLILHDKILIFKNMRTEEKTLIVAGKAPELKNLTPIKNLDMKKILTKN